MTFRRQPPIYMGGDKVREGSYGGVSWHADRCEMRGREGGDPGIRANRTQSCVSPELELSPSIRRMSPTALP
jgi:hypothetical protein